MNNQCCALSPWGELSQEQQERVWFLSESRGHSPQPQLRTHGTGVSLGTDARA